MTDTVIPPSSVTPEPGSSELADPSIPVGVMGPPARVTDMLSNARCLPQQGNNEIANGQLTRGLGRIYAFWSASASSVQANQKISAYLKVAETQTSLSEGFANRAADHLTLLRRRGTLGHFPGAQPYAVWAGDNTVTDTNDLVSLTTIEMGLPPVWHQLASAVGTASSYTEYASVPFTCFGGPLLICASATGYRHAGAGNLTGMVLSIDGAEVGRIQLYADDAEVHRAFVPLDFLVQQPPGEYTLVAAPALNTAIDGNDGYSITIFELTGPPSVINVTVAQGTWPAASGTITTSGGTLIACLASSGSCAGTGIQIAVVLEANNLYLGQAGIYSSESKVRMCMVANDIVIPNAPAVVNWSLYPLPGTIVDVNDYWSVTFIEVATAWT